MPQPIDIPGLQMPANLRQRMEFELHELKLRSRAGCGDCGGEMSAVVRKYQRLAAIAAKPK
jgi:hypothetical protein